MSHDSGSWLGRLWIVWDRRRALPVSFSGYLEVVYRGFSSVLRFLDPLFSRIGYGRAAKAMVCVELPAKKLVFGCKMCGNCTLSQTGMSCPMLCPKSIRNGPCGGVREDGGCEVKPQMRCVWVEAWRGAQSMRAHGDLSTLQAPADHQRKGRSSWIDAARERPQ